MTGSSATARRVRRPARAREQRERILVVDPQKLRQAGLVLFLKDWAEQNDLAVLAISAPEEMELSSNCAIVVLSVGGASVREQGPQLWINIVRNVLSHTPLVIVSDREERSEINAAFEHGAKGFIATSLEPSLALEALNFLRRGGSFFPLSAIQGDPQSAPVLSPSPTLAWNSPSIARRAVVRVSARLAHWRSPQDGDGGEVAEQGQSGFPLTPRQFEVLERLREGKPNKLIARDLQMTEATVKVHVRQIMRKLGAANRTQAVLCAVGIVSAGSGE
jgi:DNA-binding NarL/FixJ family response regulator